MKIKKIASSNIINDKMYSSVMRVIDKIKWKSLSEWVVYGDDSEMIFLGFISGSDIYSIKITVKLDFDNSDISSYNISAFLNAKRERSGAGAVLFFEAGGNSNIEEEIKNTLSIFNINNFSTKGAYHKKEIEEIPRNIRLTKRKGGINGHPTELIIELKTRVDSVIKQTTCTVNFFIKKLDSGKVEEKVLSKDSNGKKLSLIKAKEAILSLVEHAKKSGFVGKESYNYIPEGANSSNFNFVLNDWINWKERSEKSKEIDNSMGEMGYDGIEYDDSDFSIFSRSNNKISKTAQDFEGYFSGNVPEYAAGMLGSSSVDASQIATAFSKTDDAIRLVNQFDSSLLQNISFIFNFSKSGAYGVYLSELDRAIKTKALEKKLNSMGYDVKTDDQGLLTAYPKDKEASSEEIQTDIDSIYGDLESKGGTAFGINMNSIVDASKQDAAATGSQDSSMWEWITLIHLGGTIVHEAVHAKGHQDEGVPKEAENKFAEWALPIVNEEYKKNMESQGKGDQFSPLQLGNQQRHAKATGWFKVAQQLAYYLPESAYERPVGSDLNGRFPEDLFLRMNRNSYGFMDSGGGGSNAPIETKLGRQFMMGLPQDVNQETESIEKQLRKITKENIKIDPKSSMDKLLSKDYDENVCYKTMEELLDETRPKPLMKVIKNASINKTATLFGWMNNFEITDGSTLEGLSDRVFPFADEEQDLEERENKIREQSRYNPTYDLKGFYYRWIEPRMKPYLFDDPGQDLSSVAPARRFASKNRDAEFDRIIYDVGQAIINKEILGTRFFVSEDVIGRIEGLLGDSVDFHIYADGNSGDDDIYAMWVVDRSIDKDVVDEAEEHVKSGNHESEAVEKITSYNKRKLSVLSEVTSCLNGNEEIEKLNNDSFLIRMDSTIDTLIKFVSKISFDLDVDDFYCNHDNSIIYFEYKGICFIFTNSDRDFKIR